MLKSSIVRYWDQLGADLAIGICLIALYLLSSPIFNFALLGANDLHPLVLHFFLVVCTVSTLHCYVLSSTAVNRSSEH